MPPVNYDQLPKSLKAKVDAKVDAKLGTTSRAPKDRRQATERGLPLTHLRCGYVEENPSDYTLRKHDEACGSGRWEHFAASVASHSLGAPLRSATGDESPA